MFQHMTDSEIDDFLDHYDTYMEIIVHGPFSVIVNDALPHDKLDVIYKDDQGHIDHFECCSADLAEVTDLQEKIRDLDRRWREIL